HHGEVFEPVHQDQIRGAVTKAGVKDARIQGIGPAANNEFMIALEQSAADENALDAGKKTIIQALGNSPLAGKFTIRDGSVVGPQAGSQLRKQALVATLYSLLGMLVYLWFRVEMIYGVTAVVAVVHDTLFTIGVFALTNTDTSL